jgi:hypothetical protein
VTKKLYCIGDEDVADPVLRAERACESSSNAESVPLGKHSTRHSFGVFNTHARDDKIGSCTADLGLAYVNIADVSMRKVSQLPPGSELGFHREGDENAHHNLLKRKAPD